MQRDMITFLTHCNKLHQMWINSTKHMKILLMTNVGFVGVVSSCKNIVMINILGIFLNHGAILDSQERWNWCKLYFTYFSLVVTIDLCIYKMRAPKGRHVREKTLKLKKEIVLFHSKTIYLHSKLFYFYSVPSFSLCSPPTLDDLHIFKTTTYFVYCVQRHNIF